MDELRVSLIQTELYWHNAPANREMFGEKINALKGDSDLVVLPEVFSSGFTNEAELAAENDSATTLEWMQSTAASTGVAICGSVVHRLEQGYSNRLYFVCPDGTTHHYDKVHLFRMAGEHKKYQAGNERLVIEFAGWKILLTVCYDLRFPVFMRNRVLENTELEYDLVICVANWPSPRTNAWRTLLQARAMENLSYVAGVNRIGKDGNDLEYSGDSMLVDFKGEHIIDHPANQAFVATEIISKQQLNSFREKFPAHLDADNFSIELKTS